MHHSSVRSRSPHKGFHPSDIAAIRNGYWWAASGTTGIGTTGFRVIEQNGHSSFDLVQATVAAQPTVLTENGGVQFRMRNAADSNPSLIKTADAVQAGWTGSTYVGMWLRLPNNSGVATGNGAFFQHNATGAGNARFNATQSNLTVGLTVSQDGSTLTSGAFGSGGAYMNGAVWRWLEFVFDAAGVDNATRVRAFLDLVEQTRVGGVNTVQNSLNNPTVQLAVACRGQNSLANVDTTDWATVYYANGIPTAAERALLARHAAPIAVSF